MPFGQFTKKDVKRIAKYEAKKMDPDYARKKKENVKATKGYVKKQIGRNIETKYVQTASGIQAVWASNTTAGSLWYDVCGGISQSFLDFGGRVGDRIKMKSFHLNYTFFYPAGATSYPSSTLRVMVVQYKRNDGAPLSTELLRTTTILGAAAYSSLSHRNRDYLRFYNVLYDKRHTVFTNTAAATSIPKDYRIDRSVNVSLKRAVKNIQFTAGSTNSVNGIFVFFIGDQPTVASNPNIAANWELTYKDA